MPRAFSISALPLAAVPLALLSFLTHFQSITRGVLQARDVLYFAMLIAFFLFTTAVALDLRKAE